MAQIIHFSEAKKTLEQRKTRELIQRTLNHMDEIDGAMEALERSAELRPSPRAFYTMGILYDRKKQPDLAEVMYRRAKELGGW